ncbi:hypothetical protein DL766_007185 [Monosporascus sp. MC13-8B]|uniref:Uncharacterized protein n=1 Tax=Monosporascus cannonballus TaxID=155416 RepID=A0ABY0H3W0_9PEZI|nr:hypothetical protein DL762_007291 [Monosporascus cannonballus]RYO94546.1 hypothetical protein DL763_004053 [Monosporascus cannonballus]RYP24918.1 hypothetical protein DL766_007185 [Monosporascus sp. MC13-8B]
MVPGSPNHLSRFVPATPESLPAALLLGPEGAMSGTPHAGPHAADLLRLPLLFLHGGVWLDVGFMLFRDLDSLCWDALASADNPLELAGFRMTVDEGIATFWNGFIAARKGWSPCGSGTGLAEHPLLRYLPRYEVPSSTGQPPAFKYAAYADYLIQMFCLERLRHTRDPALGLGRPGLVRARGAAVRVRHQGVLGAGADALGRAQAVRYAEPPEAQRGARRRRPRRRGGYGEAKAFVDGILATSSTMKISHGIVTEQRKYPARI